MRLRSNRSKFRHITTVAGMLTLYALADFAAAAGLPNNPKDPPAPPTGTEFLWQRAARQDSENQPAMGQPVISGVPELAIHPDSLVAPWFLKAGKGTITDPNGTTKADRGDAGYAYTYQWVFVGSLTESDLTGETSNLHTMEESTIPTQRRVKVWFTDDAGNSEGPLISAPFAKTSISVAELLENADALFKNTSKAITPKWERDPDGISLINLRYEGFWVGAAQQFTTGNYPGGYTLTKIGIRNHNVPDNMDRVYVTLNAVHPSDQILPGQVLFAMNNAASFQTQSVNYFTAPGGAVRLAPSTKYWIVVNDNIDDGKNWLGHTTNWFQISLTGHTTTDRGALPGFWLTRRATIQHYSHTPWFVSDLYAMVDARGVRGYLGDPNSPATGVPIIVAPFDDTAAKGHWVGASTDQIADSDGRVYADADHPLFGFKYQWIRVDGATESEIPGATRYAYQLTEDDVGNQVKARVSFTDDRGFDEGPLTSAVFPPGGTISDEDATDPLLSEQVLVDNTANAAYNIAGDVVSQNFKTGNNPNGYKVTSVKVGIGSSGGSNILVRIYKLSGGQPSVLLRALESVSTKANSVVTFAIPEGLTLERNKSYAVVITDKTGLGAPGPTLSATQDGSETSDLTDNWRIANSTNRKINFADPYWTSYQLSSLRIAIQGFPIDP